MSCAPASPAAASPPTRSGCRETGGNARVFTTTVNIKEFCCFVEILPGKDGMCHISELADFRVKRVEDIVKVGDMIWVKCIGVDERGKIKLSRKAAMKERDEATANGAPAPASAN